MLTLRNVCASEITDIIKKFLLKELANGEYVLMDKVYLKDRKEPVLLQRYTTLWESGCGCFRARWNS